MSALQSMHALPSITFGAPSSSRFTQGLITRFGKFREALREQAARRSFERSLRMAPPNVRLELLAASAHRTTLR